MSARRSTDANDTVSPHVSATIVEEISVTKSPPDSARQALEEESQSTIELEIESLPTGSETVEEIEVADTALDTKPYSPPRLDFEVLNDLKQHSIELDFDAVKGSTAQILRSAAEAAANESILNENAVLGETVRRRLLARRSDLSGLPFQTDAQCRKRPEELAIHGVHVFVGNGCLVPGHPHIPADFKFFGGNLRARRSP